MDWGRHDRSGCTSATATLQTHVPIRGRLSIYGESGLAVTSRRGFEIGDASAVKDVHFSSPLFGAGLEYHANPTWDFVASGIYIRRNAEHRQPHTMFASAGFRINLRPLPAERVKETQDAGRLIPENLIQIGYSTNAFGYGANNFLSGEVPIFWRGRAEVEQSVVNIQYHRNVFYTKRSLHSISEPATDAGRAIRTEKRFTRFPCFR